jgi:hypothetical protein
MILENNVINQNQVENSALEDKKIIEENKKSTFPTLLVSLPSKGLLYPESNYLSKGVVEMKYMTAKEEDILTTESYIKQGVVLDKLFQSMIVSIIDYDSMLVCDKDAIMVAARIYGYGERYKTKVETPSGNTIEVDIDLNDIKHKEFNPDNIEGFENYRNRFIYKTMTGDIIEFKLLDNKDAKIIEEKLKKYKKPNSRDTQLTSRLCQMITSINDNSDPNFIRLFVENMRAVDSRSFRQYIDEVSPGVDLSIELVDEATGEPFLGKISFKLDLFWPDART